MISRPRFYRIDPTSALCLRTNHRTLASSIAFFVETSLTSARGSFKKQMPCYRYTQKQSVHVALTQSYRYGTCHSSKSLPIARASVSCPEIRKTRSGFHIGVSGSFFLAGIMMVSRHQMVHYHSHYLYFQRSWPV